MTFSFCRRSVLPLAIPIGILLLASTARPEDRPAGDGAAREVVAKVSPAVVTIETPGGGLGSGFVVDDAGTVVTNFHVVAGATEATVVLPDKTTAKVIGFTAVSLGRDLAVLRVEKTQGKMAFLKLAIDAPRAGDVVLAFGAPKALRGSVSDGIVSAVRSGNEVRDILKQVEGTDIYVEALGYDLDATWIQTSAPISPGNSGGPLVNRKGEVVGVMTWSEPHGQNLNFAISAEHVTNLLRGSKMEAKPLASLPQPKVAVKSLTKANGQRTLEYWNQRAKIEADAFVDVKRPNIKNPKAISEAFAKFGTRISNADFTYVYTVRSIDTTNVDSDLVDAVNAHASACRSLGSAWLKCGEAIRAKNRLAIDEANKEITTAVQSMTKVEEERFIALRRDLSERYGIAFPHHRTSPSPRGVSNVAPKAASDLKLAKSLLKEGKKDSARRYLKSILKDYAVSDEASEAATLLKSGGTTKEEDELINAQKTAKAAFVLIQSAVTLANRGENESAVKEFNEAIRLDPKSELGYNNLAWFFATCPDDPYRNGRRAVELATKACELARWKNVMYLDTLAAACAESGDFKKAATWQEKALSGAPKTMESEMRSRLDLYKSGKPYREAQQK